jgi:hypothetical protein
MKKIFLLTIAFCIPFFAFAESENEAKYTGGFELGRVFQISPPVNLGGVSNLLELNLEKSITTLNVNFINGFDLKIPNMRTFFGIGVGLEYSEWEQQERWKTNTISNLVKYDVINMPCFMRVKIDFTATKVSPFFQFDLGYNVLLLSNFEKEHSDQSYKRRGVLLSPAFGVNLNLNEKQRFCIGFHYVLQEQDRSEFHTFRNIHSYGIKLGLLF